MLRHFDIAHADGMAWYGLKREGYPPKVREQLQRDMEQAHAMGLISEREAEVDVFLSILSSLKQGHVTLVEVGAGWGEWCMALVGALRNRIAGPSATYHCVGIEANQKHYANMTKNFATLDGGDGSCEAWWGAVSDRMGFVKFDAGEIADEWCGGNISGGPFRGSRLLGKLWSFWHKAMGRTVDVSSLTLDGLAMDRVDILHIDVQGAEEAVIRGAKDTLKRTRYVMIGTHGAGINRRLPSLLPDHRLMLNLLPGIAGALDGRLVRISKGQDGLQLYGPVENMGAVV